MSLFIIVISNQNYGQIFYDDQKGYPLDIFHDFEKNIGVSYLISIIVNVVEDQVFMIKVGDLVLNLD
ncbi:hypothetical protein DERP_007709 [Dermatophagoides pteronyssinus]|uniref:Uncharacterized protein n=1 Tax=Dermatophagoides pteronyssinus TaxID=6956 RepID=A0ABQ8JL86_DERPT|nr:hypothetical protein DERP_007709 [Dermatophagoides pteronyssinus]